MSMEIFFKAIITIVVIVVSLFFLMWIWRSQIDLKATFHKIIKKSIPGTDIIATRDPTKIYQAGKEVGEVTGKVDTTDGRTVFEELCETAQLKHDIPFEFQRKSYRIISIEGITGMKVVASTNGSEVKTSVLSNVVCEEVQ